MTVIIETIKSWLRGPKANAPSTITFDPDVGGSFDHYARTWKPARTDIEVTRTGKGVERDPAKKDQLRLPGDEWGEQQGLTDVYSRLIPELNPGEGPIDLLEIGAGAGRLTEVLVRTFSQRLGRYETVDVRNIRRVELDEPVELEGLGALAFDGERERILKPGQKATLRIRRNGPWVIDVDRVHTRAAHAGWFRMKASA